MKCDTKGMRLPLCDHNDCWDAYFENRLQKTLKERRMYLQAGREPFVLLNGAKYTKHFLNYIQRLEKKKYGQISSTDTLKSE